jgi:hypothetical protein
MGYMPDKITGLAETDGVPSTFHSVSKTLFHMDSCGTAIVIAHSE